MNGVWNLDPIYRGFDDPAFEGDMQKLSQKVADIDLTDKSFWAKGLQTIADQIDQLCILLEE